HEAMRLRFVIHMVLAKVFGFGGGLGFVWYLSAGGIDDGALARGNTGSSDGMILDIVNRLIEAAGPVALQVRLTAGEARHRATLDQGRLPVRCKGIPTALSACQRLSDQNNHHREDRARTRPTLDH